MHAAVVARRTARVLLADFWYFSSVKSTREEKVTLCIIAGRRRRRPLQDKTQVQPTEKAKNMYSVPSAHILDSRQPTLLCGRADNACTNLLGFFVHFVRTRGMVKIAESDKTADFHFILCRTHLPRMARATDSCTRRVFFKREESPLK